LTRLDPGIIALVLLAAVLHASWNAVVKSDADRLASMGLVMAAGSVFGVFVIPFVPLPAPEAWTFLAASALIHVFYYIFLLKAYRWGDLSHVYPIARGIGPLLVAILSGRLVGEVLSWHEVFGVSLVSGGIASLALSGGWPRGHQWRPVIYAVLTGITIAGYTFADGLGARHSGNALSYIAWLNFLEGPWVLVFAVLVRRRSIVPYLQRTWWRGLGGGFIATVGYGIAIWALSLGAMAHVAALRETSVIFAATFGALFLKESFGTRRILAAALVASGLVLMNLRF
jgi:drug/metabolite transporter (DMT)-like permease